jgi:YYY domain-containing protein
VGPGTFAYELVDSTAGEAAYPPALPIPRSTFWDELQALLSSEFESLRQLGSGPVWHWLALPFVLGALAAINTWDLPTYLGLMCAAFALARYRAGLRPDSLVKGIVLLVEIGLFSVLLLSATMLLYRPFFVNYSAPADVGLGLVKDKIPFDEFFKLWGFFGLIVLTWLAVELRPAASRFAPLRAVSLFIRRWNVFPHLLVHYRTSVKTAAGNYKLLLTGAVWLFVLAIFMILLKYTAVALLLPWVGLAFLLLLRWDVSAERAFVTLLAFTALLLLLGVQFVYLNDFLGGGDYYRMNTYFKFFIQVWVMIALAAAVMLPELWERTDRWPLSRRVLWQGAVVVLAFSSLVYFVLGTPSRIDSRFPNAQPAEPTLDGLAYMSVGEFEFEWPIGSGVFNRIQLNADYEAIRWLQASVEGTPVIAEAHIGYYRENGMRVAAYTGLPSLLGNLHQGEQHPPNELGPRDQQIRNFWAEGDSLRKYEQAQQLNVQYVYLGQLERVVHGEYQTEVFDALVRQGLAEVVFENDLTKIYRLVSQGNSE